MTSSPFGAPARRIRAWAAAAATAAAAACASSPAARRAATIADADQIARRALADEERLDPARIPPRAVGVLPFAAAPGDTLLGPLGFALADLLVTDLSRSPQLQLVERTRTDAILRELALVDSGVVDPRTAPRVGRLIGARRLLIGDVASQPGGGVVLRARVVDAIAGTVEDLVSASAPLDRIIDAEKQLALRLFEELGVQLTPAQRTLVEARQTQQLAALVAFGRGREAEARGDVTGAQRFFGEAARLDVAFTAAVAESRAVPRRSAAGSGANVRRVAALSARAINAAAPVRVADAADVPFRDAAPVVQLILSIRVTP
jgi:TolB-like protein